MDETRLSQDITTKITCLVFALLRRWTIILLVALVCGFGLDVYRTVTYVPYYGMKVTASLAAEEANTFKELEKMRSYIPTLSYLFNSRSAKNYVKEKMGVNSTTINTSIKNDEANIIILNVTAKTRREAYYGMKYLLSWYRSSNKSFAFPYSLTIIETSYISLTPANEINHTYNLMRGGSLGAIGMIGLLSVIYFFRQTIKSKDDVKRHLQRRLYVSVPKEHKKRGLKFWQKNRKPILITSLKTSFRFKEAINKLRNRIESSFSEHHFQSLMITSALENEGKSTVTANLALALAKNDHNVLLIDGDIRKPSVAKMFELNQDEHLSVNKYLAGEASWQSQVMTLPVSGLNILACDQDLKHANEYLSGENFHTLIHEAKKVYDYVIIDVSPAYSLDEPSAVNKFVDATLVVVKQDVAFRNVINETITRLASVRENILGVVFNESVPDFTSGARGSYSRYGYNRYESRRKEN